MTLPEPLRDGIDDLVGGADRRRVEHAARALSDAYRAGGRAASRAARTRDDVVAYAAARAPATYAAVAAVLAGIRERRPDWEPASVLDLGAGPGVACWAAAAVWPGIARYTLVEAEPEMLAVGRTLARRAGSALARATWIQGDACADTAAADLVVSSYLLGELEEGRVESFARHVWGRCADTAVFVEPGTTSGYRRALAVRTTLLAEGGFTLAPCPHDTVCPLSAGDWCHFATRLPRSPAHRAAKTAERGFEDEKFSYAALSRAPQARAQGRIIRRPHVNPGHVVLAVCAPGGIERRTVSRREKDAYRRARKLGWGDAL